MRRTSSVLIIASYENDCQITKTYRTNHRGRCAVFLAIKTLNSHSTVPLCTPVYKQVELLGCPARNLVYKNGLARFALNRGFISRKKAYPLSSQDFSKVVSVVRLLPKPVRLAFVCTRMLVVCILMLVVCLQYASVCTRMFSCVSLVYSAVYYPFVTSSNRVVFLS